MTGAATPAVAIVTSQRHGEVALMDADGRIHSEAVRTAAHGDDLLPALERLCAAHGVLPRSLHTVVVDVGPGGFTGLRVGIAAAKFIADVSGAALVAVPSAHLVAAGLDLPSTVGRLLVVLATKPAAGAGQASTHAGTAWCSSLERSGGRWIEQSNAVGPAALRTLDWIADEHLRAASASDAIVGEAAFLPEAHRVATARGVAWIEPRWSAAAALTLGLAMLSEGQRSDPLALRPIYPRPPEAETLWERRLAEKRATGS